MANPNEFYDDIKGIINNWKKANPIACHYLGIHDYDGTLPNFSKEAVINRIDELKEDITYLISLRADYSDSYTLFEFNLVKLALEKELFELETRKEYTNNPLFFIRALSIIEGSYTLRSFAPLEKRIDSIISIETKIPEFLSYAYEWLEESLPSVKVNLSIQYLQGIINYYKNKLIEFIELSADTNKKITWEKTNATAIKTMEEFLDKLRDNFLPNSHNKFALGSENYLKLLSKQEFVSIDLAELLLIGEKDLDRNYQALKDILKKKGGRKYLDEVLEDYPEADELVSYAKSTLDRVLQFL